ncbi:hypothetical protein LJC59_10015 [Desulfovibrio sp. OttesenSCG-928-A18]|nr:hypothetical protein [Desulfovibrio sp. OttesenSCG-928-A18]
MSTHPDSIAIHHIGGRGGTFFLSDLTAFREDFQVYLYDADAACLDDLENAPNMHVLPYCVGECDAQSDFHIYYEQTNSSRRHLHPDYQEWWSGIDYCDIPLGQASQPVSTQSLPMRCLDSILHERPEVRPPDVLSIDAESTGVEIVEGAAQCIEKNVVCIVCEIEFMQWRQGQKYLPELLRLLAKDFHFAGYIRQDTEISPFRAPLGFRGKEFPAANDALFLRKKQSAPDLLKLAFIAFATGFTEYGFHCLQGAELDERMALCGDGRYTYMTFLRQLLNVFNASEHVHRLSFMDLNPTFEDSRCRRSRTTPPAHIAPMRSAMERKQLRMAAQRCTEFEQVFYAYGLPHIARLIEDRRRTKEYYL